MMIARQRDFGLNMNKVGNDSFRHDRCRSKTIPAISTFEKSGSFRDPHFSRYTTRGFHIIAVFALRNTASINEFNTA